MMATSVHWVEPPRGDRSPTAAESFGASRIETPVDNINAPKLALHIHSLMYL